MNIVVMWMVVFLANGAPIPSYKVFPEGFVCTDQAALEAAQQIARSLPDTRLQDDVLWTCVNVISPGPIRPALFRGLTEARS